MGNGITDILEQPNGEALKVTFTTIASETLNLLAEQSKSAVKAGAYTFGSLAVEPAVWLFTGKGPNFADVAGWVFGAGSAAAKSMAATSASVFSAAAKAIIDAQVKKNLQEAMRSEPDLKKAPCIDLCSNYSFFSKGSMVDAMEIAKAGGVAWQHPNGFWFYMKDAKGRPVCDYEPAVYSQVFAPVLPLTPLKGGGFEWFKY